MLSPASKISQRVFNCDAYLRGRWMKDFQALPTPTAEDFGGDEYRHQFIYILNNAVSDI
jgi:hypothetical protein